MILTTKGRYAVMAMIDLCESSTENPNSKTVPLLSISQRQNISLSYLEQIFSKLRKSGIVTSIKGPGGGYVLGKDPKSISVCDIIYATGESIKMTSCGNLSKSCKTGITKRKCRTHDLWNGLESKINEYLSSISIYDICKNENYKF